jgi:acetyl-CoA acetyltransferase
MSEKEAAIVGVGYSPITRHGGPSKESLTATAIRNALQDSGAEPKDVDGIFTYRFPSGTEAPPVHWVMNAMGINDVNVWMELYPSAPSGVAPVLAAIQAILSGTCEVAVVYRCITTDAGPAGSGIARPKSDYVDAVGAQQWNAPFGIGDRGRGIADAALRMRRRMADYGAVREDWGQIALNARRWAAENERAVLRTPLTMDDYLNVRMIMEPFCLYDSDYPVSGCTAIVITSANRARQMRSDPVYVDSWAYGSGAPDAPEREQVQYGGMVSCSQRLWERSSFSPESIDVAELYDGYTFITLSWIEALGFCPYGEFPSWVDNGRTIGPGGTLPMNTHGGMVAEGRLHGLSFVTEAVLQLRGECGVRQVPQAQTAIVAAAYNTIAGALVLRGNGA